MKSGFYYRLIADILREKNTEIYLKWSSTKLTILSKHLIWATVRLNLQKLFKIQPLRSVLWDKAETL